jgi:hypothetical protein
MAEIETELLQLADRQEALANALSAPEVNGPIEAMERAARAVEKAWSKSWLGYQAYIYYRDLEPPPPGAHFSSEWGFQQLQTIRTTTGDWKEYTPDDIVSAVGRIAGNPDLAPTRALVTNTKSKFESDRSEALSLLSMELAVAPDEFLNTIRTEIGELKFHSESTL